MESIFLRLINQKSIYNSNFNVIKMDFYWLIYMLFIISVPSTLSLDLSHSPWIISKDCVIERLYLRGRFARCLKPDCRQYTYVQLRWRREVLLAESCPHSEPALHSRQTELPLTGSANRPSRKGGKLFLPPGASEYRWKLWLRPSGK